MMDRTDNGVNLLALCTLKRALHQYKGVMKPKLNTARSRSRISFTLLFLINRKIISLRDEHACVLCYYFRKDFHENWYKNKLLVIHLDIIFNLRKLIITK